MLPLPSLPAMVCNRHLLHLPEPWQLQADTATLKKQLAAATTESSDLAQQLSHVEGARQVSEQAHQTHAGRARELQQQVESLSTTLEAERGQWTEERQGLQVWGGLRCLRPCLLASVRIQH